MNSATSTAAHDTLATDHWVRRCVRGYEAWVEDIWRQWETLEDLPGARIVKHNPARTVIALPATLVRPSCYVKRYHIRDTFEKLKYMVVPSRAKAEWRALLFLERQGMFVPRAWGMGEERHGGVLQRAGLIMEGVVDAEPLPRFLERERGESRREVLQSLGSVVGQLHCWGASHGDLHAGNVLVQTLPGRSPRVCLLDLHTCRTGAFLPRLQRHGNLAKLFHSLFDDLSREEWTLLLRSYRVALSPSPHLDAHSLGEFHDHLRAKARGLEWKRLGSRSRRCWKNTSEFKRQKQGGWSIHRRRDFDDRLLQALGEERFEITEVLKERSGQRVLKVRFDESPTHYVLKERVERGILSRLWLAVGGWGPLEVAWWGARALDVRHIPTPRAWALLRDRRFGLPHRAWLLTDCVDGRTLRDELLEEYYPRQPHRVAQLRRRVVPLVHAIRQLHDTGIYHRDLNPLNVLVGRGQSGDVEYFVIDLDSIRPWQRPNETRRLRNLVQLATIPEGHLRRGDLLYWLRAYARGDERYLQRDVLGQLDAQLAREILRIIARISHKERHHPLDPEVCDVRFREAARHLTGPDVETGRASSGVS